MFQKAHSCQGNLTDYLKRFKFQPELTRHLDALTGEAFSQEMVNEIVLWKVNRYVRLPVNLRESLHALRTLRPDEHYKSERVLVRLLRCRGVDLAMASTFLRFTNPEVFQIIDRHAYRAINGEPYSLHTATPKSTKVSTYFKYLDALRSLAASSGTAFRDLDGILYVFDKEHNGTL